MFKIILLIVILIFCSFVGAPLALQKFTIWDAANSGDDKQGISKLLYGLTPHLKAANINQSMDIASGGHIIDVRTKQEFEQGYIKNALNIPEETLYDEIPKKFPDKNTLLYLYCDNGYRGATATRLLRSMGYERAFNIEQGLKGWEKSGFQLIRQNQEYF